jgi:hypothetical protein
VRSNAAITRIVTAGAAQVAEAQVNATRSVVEKNLMLAEVVVVVETSYVGVGWIANEWLGRKE